MEKLKIVSFVFLIFLSACSEVRITKDNDSEKEPKSNVALQKVKLEKAGYQTFDFVDE